MKSKLSLILGVLVLMLVVIGTVPANAAVAPAVDAPPAAAATPVLPASFLCSLNQSVDAQLPTEGAFPPFAKPATLPPCGTCSDFVCQGHSLNFACGTDPITLKTKHCYDLGQVCQPTGEIQCRCRVNVP